MAIIFSSLIVSFIIFPWLFFILIYSTMKFLTKNSRKSRNTAINLTTIILMVACHSLIMTIWSSSMLWLIILILLVTAIIFSFIYWKIKEEIIYSKLLFGYIRFNFLLFSLLYVLIFIYGIVIRAIQAL